MLPVLPVVDHYGQSVVVIVQHIASDDTQVVQRQTAELVDGQQDVTCHLPDRLVGLKTNERKRNRSHNTRERDGEGEAFPGSRGVLLPWMFEGWNLPPVRAPHLRDQPWKSHLQEGEVPVVLHHGDLKVAHHNLTVGVDVFGEVVLDLRVPSCAQAILGARTNHCKSKECSRVNKCL